jgi:biotin synthase
VYVSNWNALAQQVLDGKPISADDARGIVRSSDDDLLPLLGAAFQIRQKFHGRDVRLHVLQNAKSGKCPEDCAFCSQSSRYDTGIDQYRMQTVEELVEGARRAHAMGAVKYCMVTATRGP